MATCETGWASTTTLQLRARSDQAGFDRAVIEQQIEAMRVLGTVYPVECVWYSTDPDPHSSWPLYAIGHHDSWAL